MFKCHIIVLTLCFFLCNIIICKVYGRILYDEKVLKQGGNMSIKKISSILLAVTLTMSLTACTTSTSSTSNPSETLSSAETTQESDASISDTSLSDTTETTETDEDLTLFDSTSKSGTDPSVADYYSHIESVTALGEVYPSGEKIVGLAIQYDCEIDGSSLTLGGSGVGQQASEAGLGSYSVLSRSITNIYTNDTASLSEDGGLSSGNYVILELGLTDSGARTMLFHFPKGEVGTDGPVSLSTSTVSVCQLEDITDVAGNVIEGDSSSTRYLDSETVSDPDVDQFTMGTYSDENTATYANFELALPDDYDASQSYPLVLFLPDAGIVSDDSQLNLRQGLGAVSWANDGDCFVLTVDESSENVEACFDLIQALVDKGYSIDLNRIYGTGESAGCMALISYTSEHPDDSGFAALLLVAGQGDLSGIVNIPTVIFVSEDDESSYNGIMDEAEGLPSLSTDYLDVSEDLTYNYDGNGNTSGLWVDYGDADNPSGNQSGAKAGTSDRTIDQVFDDLNTSVQDSLSEAAESNTNIIFFHIEAGTLDSTDSSIGGGNTHNFTWQYAYNLPALRNWIYAQSKES